MVLWAVASSVSWRLNLSGFPPEHSHIQGNFSRISHRLQRRALHCYKCRRSCPSMAHIVKLSSLLVLYLVRGLICFDMLYNLHMLLVHSCPLFSSLSFSPLSNKCQLFACLICPFSECALLTLSKWNYTTALWILHSDWLMGILRCWLITVQGCTRLI